MSEIILPPVPSRPLLAVRPTMVPVAKVPDGRGTDVEMVPFAGPEPEPEPQPEPEPETTIGSVFIVVDGVQVVYGEPVHVRVDTPVEVAATINGDAQPTYKWEARGGYPMGVSEQAAATVLTFPQEGGPTVTLTVQSSNASDSPITYGMNFYVASQAEWDALHPAS